MSARVFSKYLWCPALTHVAGGLGSDGDLKTALRYLKRAATLGTESMEVDNLSVTFLNLCAVLSQSGKCVPAASPCGVLRVGLSNQSADHALLTRVLSVAGTSRLSTTHRVRCSTARRSCWPHRTSRGSLPRPRRRRWSR